MAGRERRKRFWRALVERWRPPAAGVSLGQARALARDEFARQEWPWRDDAAVTYSQGRYIVRQLYVPPSQGRGGVMRVEIDAVTGEVILARCDGR